MVLQNTAACGLVTEPLPGRTARPPRSAAEGSAVMTSGEARRRDAPDPARPPRARRPHRLDPRRNRQFRISAAPATGGPNVWGGEDGSPRHAAAELERPAAAFDAWLDGRLLKRLPRRTPRPGPGVADRRDGGGRRVLPGPASPATRVRPRNSTAPRFSRRPAEPTAPAVGAKRGRSASADLAAVLAHLPTGHDVAAAHDLVRPGREFKPAPHVRWRRVSSGQASVTAARRPRPTASDSSSPIEDSEDPRIMLPCRVEHVHPSVR